MYHGFFWFKLEYRIWLELTVSLNICIIPTGFPHTADILYTSFFFFFFFRKDASAKGNETTFLKTALNNPTCMLNLTVNHCFFNLFSHENEDSLYI